MNMSYSVPININGYVSILINTIVREVNMLIKLYTTIKRLPSSRRWLPSRLGL